MGIIQEIDEFLAKHTMAESQFGKLAVNDRHLVKQIREGRDLRLSTVERIRAFMAEYVPAASEQAGAA